MVSMNLNEGSGLPDKQVEKTQEVKEEPCYNCGP